MTPSERAYVLAPCENGSSDAGSPIDLTLVSWNVSFVSPRAALFFVVIPALVFSTSEETEHECSQELRSCSGQEERQGPGIGGVQHDARGPHAQHAR